MWFRTSEGGECSTPVICEMIAVLSLEAGQQLFYASLNNSSLSNKHVKRFGLLLPEVKKKYNNGFLPMLFYSENCYDMPVQTRDTLLVINVDGIADKHRSILC